MHQFKKTIIPLGLSLALLCQQFSYAQAVVKSLHTDPRAKTAAYNPYQVYAVKTNYLISTDIIFSDDEYISEEDYHLGDSTSWDVQAVRNHLYIKAKKMEAGGNLNVTTNKHTYHFVLSVDPSNNDNLDQVLFLKFSYPYEKPKKDEYIVSQNIQLPADICDDWRKYNMQYSFTGDAEQAPIRACDDGTFTYLKFSKQTDLPAVFMVLPDRRETVLNYRMENGYLVIERTAKAFTLRNGKTVTSVYNDRYICDWQKVAKRT